MSRPIQLVLQTDERGPRQDIPGNWTPKSTLAEVMAKMEGKLSDTSFEGASLRFVKTTIEQSKWSSTTLQDIELTGRALLILKLAPKKSSAEPMEVDPVTNTASKLSDDKLRDAADFLLSNNFDVDTKVCIVTLIRVIDNVLQKPGETKVRSIRLANAAFAQKVVERKGGVEYLLACGFQLQQAPPPILSKAEKGEDCLVLTEANEDHAHLISARRMLTLKATKELLMKADELPTYKAPAKLTSPSDHTVGRTSSRNEFNPYKGQKYDAKSAATGRNLGPDAHYVSTTEQKLKDLQTQQSKLEKKFHKPLEDRRVVALMPNTTVPPQATVEVGAAPSDGKLLAAEFKKREQDRKEREEGGFTTKAMRDLKAIQNKKVYSHVQLRIQFPDACALEAKFLPRETVQTAVEVVRSAFVSESADYEFDLYVSPPRRKLNYSNTLIDEGLVPAAKIFLSWKHGPAKGTPAGSYLKPELFQGAKPSYPSGKSLMQPREDSKPAAKKSKPTGSSKEDDMLRRMLGGQGGLGRPRGGGSGNGKPKWFKKG